MSTAYRTIHTIFGTPFRSERPAVISVKVNYIEIETKKGTDTVEFIEGCDSLPDDEVIERLERVGVMPTDPTRISFNRPKIR